jgi:ribosomal protein S18 acetylase RimI-like enzyme
MDHMNGADDVLIAKLDPSRLDELINVQNEIFMDYIMPMKSSKQFFLEFLNSVGGELGNVLVASVKGHMVGYVNPVIDGREGWIGGLGIVPAYRGKGIGKTLMSAAEDFCRSRGVTGVSLEVIEGNVKAQRLYEKLGYVATRKYLTAEGKPAKFDGFGSLPVKATVPEIVALHERSYKDTCWQRRKVHAVVASAKGSECYKVDGGFVLVRTVDTNGFVPFLGVVPEKRGMGVGTALAKYALTRLWGHGAFKVALYNVNEDLPTLRMLDKFDFKITLKQIEMRKSI